ncbi:lycopene cyclase family protein [Segetibacter aerophilus]|uniref:Lycopene cyclase n=1 Tax=Segetibacter aerophilus TaxID=670293 RepID=A0A512BFF8_9BACT|nr:lycopene cyclase family protein [Segetibacter aerophilus]GEO10694.1 lycopene cyclase [Segetibacter aerophilus]
MKQYDYIISGAGLAGLSLLMRFMTNPAFNTKSILVVDKAAKTENDHTWCFWETQAGLFEPVVHHRWQHVNFFSSQFSSLLDLAPYTYKMIRSIDFYKHVYEEAGKHRNIEFIYGRVEAAGNAGSKGLVVVDGNQYYADFVFNSILFQKPEQPGQAHYLLQHFKGFFIETKESFFKPTEATLMDFRVDQKNGTTFAYVLPFTPTKALVEYTLFSKQLLNDEDYTAALKNYISSVMGLQDYTILEQEYGVIPMTNMKFVKRVGKVINIGTAGGQTKGSSGYTFQFIQKHSDKIVADLLQYGDVSENKSLLQKRFNFYDSTLLNILSGEKLAGDKIFSDLFGKNPAERVLRFLDNETTFEDEINLMGTLPQGVFMKAAWQEIFK